MELKKSFEVTESETSVYHKEAYQITFEKDLPLHLVLDLNQENDDEEWSIGVKITQYPVSHGKHWGNVDCNGIKFKCSMNKAQLIFKNFSYIYQRRFQIEFYRILNKEIILETIALARSLTDVGIFLH